MKTEPTIIYKLHPHLKTVQYENNPSMFHCFSLLIMALHKATSVCFNFWWSEDFQISTACWNHSYRSLSLTALHMVKCKSINIVDTSLWDQTPIFLWNFLQFTFHSIWWCLTPFPPVKVTQTFNCTNSLFNLSFILQPQNGSQEGDYGRQKSWHYYRARLYRQLRPGGRNWWHWHQRHKPEAFSLERSCHRPCRSYSIHNMPISIFYPAIHFDLLEI